MIERVSVNRSTGRTKRRNREMASTTDIPNSASNEDPRIIYCAGVGASADGIGSALAWCMRGGDFRVEHIEWSDGLTAIQAEICAIVSVFRYLRSLGEPEPTILKSDTALVRKALTSKSEAADPNLRKFSRTIAKYVRDIDPPISLLWVPRAERTGDRPR
jgi:hypothetical protein